VAKLSENGDTIQYSNELGTDGGAAAARGLAVDGSGNVYIAGTMGSSDFVARLPPDLSSFEALQFGSAFDGWSGGRPLTLAANGVAVGSDGAAYVVGSTNSTDFPVTSNSFRSSYGGGSSDAFVAKVAFEDQPSSLTSPNPPNGATWVTVRPTLSWHAADATSYEVRLGTSMPLSTVVADTTEYWYSPPRLEADTMYFWQIVAKNGSGTTPGPVWSFSTDPTAGPPPGPPAPSSPNPSDGSIWVTVSPTLSWQSAGAASYEIRLGTVNPPPTVVPNTTDWWYWSPGLSAGTTYYWQIVAKNSNGTTAGPVWTFTTEPAAVNVAFDTLKRADESSIVVVAERR
jgi:hypothetical protein